jgi:hypothetical protein
MTCRDNGQSQIQKLVSAPPKTKPIKIACLEEAGGKRFITNPIYAANKIIKVMVESWCAGKSETYFLKTNSRKAPLAMAINSIGSQSKK